MITQHAASSRVRTVDRTEEWNELVASSPEGHLLQSYQWGELKSRHGWSAERLAATAEGSMAAAQVLWRPTPLGPIAYVPRGPVFEPKGNEAALDLLLAEIHQKARARRALMLKVERNHPEPGPLPALGFRPSRQTVQPKATIIVDLTQDAETLLRRQHSKTRYNIRLATKQGVKVRRGNTADVPVFARLMAETGVRDGFGVRSAAYYRDVLHLLGDHAELLLAEHDGDVLAGMLVAKFNREAIYLYGASGTLKRNLMPNHALQWEAMRRAQEEGYPCYDFWAVPSAVLDRAPEGAEGDDLPEPAEHERGDLWGVYRFKRGFGGKLVGYSGGYDYVYSRPRYWLWEHLVPRALAILRRSRSMGD
jgi:lipid II:glycine glycyltransferase (peptidoglycan interpeptide bridge formation enzyme)